MKVKCDHRSKFSNLSNWKEEAWKNQGFNDIRTRDLRDTGAMLYQLSYEATHWERGQFIEFISPVKSAMMWSIYEIIRIWTAVVDEREEWSSQLSNWKEEACSHILVARSTYWSHISCEEWSFFSFIYNHSSNNLWIISCILHIISLLPGNMNSKNWPHSQCVAS